MPRIYLAGPIDGRSREQIHDWRNQATRSLVAAGVDVLDPTRDRERDILDNDAHDVAEPLVQLLFVPETIVGRDRSDVYRCDVMLVVFDEGPKSGGTLIEIGWANAWNKPIVLVMSENNPFRHHPFSELMLGITNDLDLAVRLVLSVLGIDPNF